MKKATVMNEQKTIINESPSGGERTITDLGGNVVTIPPAEEIKRVVVMTPPTTVQQEVFLYNATIAENIRIGCSNASMEEVMEAARLKVF